MLCEEDAKPESIESPEHLQGTAMSNISRIVLLKKVLGCQVRALEHRAP